MISGDILERELEEIFKAQTLDKGMIEGLSVSDENGIIFTTNLAEDKFFGWAQEDLGSQHLVRKTNGSSDQSKGSKALEMRDRLQITGHWEGKFVNRKNDGKLLTMFTKITSLEYEGRKYWVRIQEDITERKRAEIARASLAAIMESSDDAIIGITLQGIITSWNKGAEKLFGYTDSEIIGLPITALIPLDRQEEEAELDQSLRRGERIEHFETVRLRKDGRSVAVSITISPIRDSSGKIIGASKIIRDISERKQIEEALQRKEAEFRDLLETLPVARSEALAENWSKDEFLSLISHELRSPINSILVYSQLLRSTPHNAEEINRTCEIVEYYARTQLGLIEDLLDTARIASGKLQLDLRPTDILPVIVNVHNVLRPAAEAKGINLRVHYGQTSEMIIGDSLRLQQVIWNLLSNAIKFTPAGGRVEVWLERNDEELFIIVSDTGVGIERETLPYIFNRFRQSDASNSPRYGGLGLGLTLTKHLVELHGGTIEAVSEGVGLGSVFTVKLPLAKQSELLEAESPAASDTVSGEEYGSTQRFDHLISQPSSETERVDGFMLKDFQSSRRDIRGEGSAALHERVIIEGIRVLVADDQQDVRTVLTDFLSKCGAIVMAVASGIGALAILDDPLNGERPDVFICNVDMRDEEGYAVLNRLRALEATRVTPLAQRIPAIALTALASQDDWVRARNAGFDIYVPRSIEPAELVAIIANLIRNRSAAA
jgi:PAS domain S-box-containing protein